MPKFFAVAMGSAVALVGFAGAANASATVDLIWIDVSATNAMGNPICLQSANRNCPPDPRSADSGVSIDSVLVTDNITLGVILTAGPNGSMGAAVSVNYGDALPNLSVVQFQSLGTTPYFPLPLGFTTNQPPYIDNIAAAAFFSVGIGLPPAQSAYLGTVTFHKNALVDGIFEITVSTHGPGNTDAVLDANGCEISGATAFNSAFLIDGDIFPNPTPTPAAAPRGSVVGWGSNYNGEATPPDDVNGVGGTATDIAAGWRHSCAIQAGTGNVVCWGSNYRDQATPPDAVNGVVGTAIAISAGSWHSCAIQSDTGNAVCWGWDSAGQATPPRSVNGVSGTASKIAAGGNTSCAIQAGTGDVVCWGSDIAGQATPPDAVNGVSGTASEIAASNLHSCAIQAGTGIVVCWGSDNLGKATPPDAVNGVSGTASDIAAGLDHSCAIQAGTGNVVCWGYDRCGVSTPPDAVNGVSGTATEVAASRHSCAIQAGTGNVDCWGSNVGAPPDAVNGVAGTATHIAAGGHHTLAIVGGLPGPTATPTPIPTATPTATPTAIPAPSADCLCEVQNINPHKVVLQNVGTGGKGSSATRKMVVTVNAVDAPGATCDAGEFSNPTAVNLKTEDDRGNILIDGAETVVCEQGVTTTVKWDVFFRGPMNCENGAVPPPKPGFSLGTITSTGSAPGTADYVESTRIKCFE